MIDVYSQRYFDRIKRVYKETLEENEKGIFIDCGGHDGCSAIKFISVNPDFDCVTFEPNPDLWKFYEDVPTTLMKSAVFSKNGRISFILDENDLGSSLIPSKQMLNQSKNVNNKIIVRCIRLAEFIEHLSKTYSKIILKLDVEGAEYEILDDLLKSNQCKNISKLYAEFHWFKCDTKIYTPIRHELLMRNLVDWFPICEWDASRFTVSGESDNIKNIRKLFSEQHFKDIKKYQNLKFGDKYE